MSSRGGDAAVRWCHNHPNRHAHALCMSCRKQVCDACATQWEGINYCVACLAKKVPESKTRSSAGGWIALVLAIVLMLWATTRLVVIYGVWLMELS